MRRRAWSSAISTREWHLFFLIRYEKNSFVEWIVTWTFYFYFFRILFVRRCLTRLFGSKRLKTLWREPQRIPILVSKNFGVSNVAFGKSSCNIMVRFWSLFLKFRKSRKGRKPVSQLPSNSSVFALILAETSISVEDMCRQLRDQKEECRKLKGK